MSFSSKLRVSTWAAISMVLFAGTVQAFDLAPQCDVNDPAKSCSPHFDEVFLKGSHNAYWVDNKHTPYDPEAAGTQMRLWDQLVHEHARSIELDIHRDADDQQALVTGIHPGEYRVYHTNEPDNSTCFLLADCLQLLQRLDYVLPQHEVIHVALELKQIDKLFQDDALFDDGRWRPEELDRLLWEHLGSRIYTPAEFMSRCDPSLIDPSLTLRDCAKRVGWPTVDQLRGRYIFTVHGTETPSFPGASNERAWWQYSSVDIRTRAAFPMFVVGGSAKGVPDAEIPSFKAARYHTQTPAFELMWRHALDNTIFFQLEDITNPDFVENDQHPVPLHRQFHGVVRSTAAFLIDHPIPSGVTSDNVGNIQQRAAVASGWQILMTDYPVNFIEDFRATGTPAIPSRVDRPFFEPADVLSVLTPDGIPDIGVFPRHFPQDSLREPGQRVYFDTQNRFTDHDLFDDAGGVAFTSDPNKRGIAYLIRMAPSPGEEPIEDWELFPATSMVGHGSPAPLEQTPYGPGCFVVMSQVVPAADRVDVCRLPHADDPRSVFIDITVYHGGKQTYYKSTAVHHNLIQGQNFGDALRVLVNRRPTLAAGTGTSVSIFTAAEVNPDGTMAWRAYPDGPFIFASDLQFQGLWQAGDGVFAGTQLNHKPIVFSEFQTMSLAADGAPTGDAFDLSFCLDGSCREKTPLAPHETLLTATDGSIFVGVNETEGAVFNNQWRTLLTTDKYEMTTSGLNQFQRPNKFFLRTTDPGDGRWQPLYRCIDWTRDLHVYWVDLDPSCPNDNGPAGRSSGVIGYLGTNRMSGAQPLYHLRMGTQNVASPNTHDHYFAVGDAERAAKMAEHGGNGYKDVAPAGYKGSLPHPVGYVIVASIPVTCTPKPSCDPGARCGTQDDGCGSTLTCGTCPNGAYCAVGNQCVPAACQADCNQRYLECLNCDRSRPGCLLPSQCAAGRTTCLAGCAKP